MRYIPAARIADDFWGKLQVELLMYIKTRKFFFENDQPVLWEASRLISVADKFRLDSNDFMIPDVPDGATRYLSEHYQASELSILRDLGMADISMTDFLERLDVDLRRSAPFMHSKTQSIQWHTKVAKLLLKASDDQAHLETIKMLSLAPLNNGSWVRSKHPSLFLPTSGGVAIPADLSLSLVDGNALLNPARTSLFLHLGVTECAPTRIFPLIGQQYLSPGMTLLSEPESLK